MAKNEFNAGVLDRKIINITGKRQITIPKKFYKNLGLGKEAECFIEKNALVIRPLYQNGEAFSVEILKDLVSEGYSGDELVARFTEERQKMKAAIGDLIKEGNDIAAGKKKGASMEDVFGKD
ncbi:MAG: AbrB/MazE/SpoVT family DNA-binding domain-containing protein [Actinobacteria bacterium]|nr:AbrB/MazE/SpoVT family DNA-binding domain-containing protein [Actinomycetota bacterium]